MPQLSAAFARPSRAFRAFSRQISRFTTGYLPFTSTTKPISLSHQRLRSFLRFVLFLTLAIFALLLLLPFVFHVPATPPPRPLPHVFEPPPLPDSTTHSLITPNTPFRIILLVPPYTNLPIPRYSTDVPLDNPSNPDYISHYSPTSLLSLLSSLVSAHYDNEPITLDLLLSPDRNATAFTARHSLCASLSWPHGSKLIRNATTGGLFELAITAWNPTKSDPEKILLVDASRAQPFSPQFYRYLKSVRRRYLPTAADIAGFTLDPVLIRRPASVLGQPTSELVSAPLPPPATVGDDVFLYQNLPFVPAFSPVNSDVWRAFQRWFAAHRSEWFLWPTVVGAKDKGDEAWGRYRGNLRAHWTLWFSRFCAEYAVYNVYPRKTRPEPLPPVGRMSSLPPLMRVDFGGRNVERSQEIEDENLERIIELGRRQGGSVSLTVVNKAFLETARSWICNVDVASIRPPGVVWITTDDEAYEGLRGVKGSQTVQMKEFRGGRAQTGTSYGTPGYWLLMLERTQLIRAILDRGVGVFLFETDQVWLRDPVPFVKRLVHSGDEVDVVGTMDTRHEIGGNFLYLNPTLSTRRVWGEVYRRFAKAYKDNRMEGHTSRYRRYMENDQSTLTKLIFFDEKFKSRNPVVFRALDTELFVDGRWYDLESKKYTSRRSRSPIVINNNFLIGIDKKKKRAQEHGHWFVSDNGQTCETDRVKRAVRDNELRAPLEDGQGGHGLEDPERHQLSLESKENTTAGNDESLTEVQSALVEGADLEAGLDEAMKAIGKEYTT